MYSFGCFINNNKSYILMKNYITKIATLGLLATAIVVVPVVAQAQDANINASSKQTTTPKLKKQKAIPFHGKLEAVDAKVMTLKVGKRTFQVTSDTRIVKDGHPATLSDGVVGEPVRGAYNKAEDGKLNALSVYFGAKSEEKRKNPADEN